MTSLPPSIVSVLELFKGPLGSVRFADIDAAGLATSAAEVEAAASEVELQEAKLTELRQGLAQRQEALLLLAQQALAYARVYAENDEPLLEELNRISLPRPTKPRKPNAAKPREARPDASPAVTSEAVTSEAVTSEAIASEAISSEDAAELDSAPTPLEPELEPSPVAPAAPRASRKGRPASAARATS